ncbi:ribosomal-protein-alanine N-acetyltransferase [Texcoconibacillus texcoconensis]|uniref:[Ribosomal protein bS18]-alanine N-acetyltransferase n=2 Tax=Texcoconibacillus texcoconensis TaxID=1095777 RepID=A0A840QMN0_9BACI|nr:ribosomal-protein-alanine N-acetyltransferase [Texcoconibacillus texcoconensis]
MKAMAEDVRIRMMEESDLEDVLLVEHESFQKPWSKNAFLNELHINKFAHYLVVECDGRVIGYCGLWVIIDEAHITNIAILSHYRRQGYGQRLLKEALQLARNKGAERLSLEVRVSNLGAQAMYQNFGFQTGGIRKNYYTDNQEDALVMWVMLR